MSDSPATKESLHSVDSEKAIDAPVAFVQSADISTADDGVNRARFSALWKAARWLDSFGVEVRGVERVSEGERNHTKVFDSFYFWSGANCQVSTFALGALGGSVFQLGLIDATLTIVFFNLLMTLPVALFSTWGAKSGLRQMVVSRFSFGRFGVFIPLVLNLLACVGWSCINTIVGSSSLHAVSTSHQLPQAAGVIIISFLTLIVALAGYRYIHAYEKWSSLPNAIIFIIMLGCGASSFSTGVGGVGAAEAASVLSFGAAIAGFALGWSSLAADYTVNHPSSTPSIKIFLATYFGLNIPMILVETLGMAMTTTFDARPDWGDAYAENGIGGLIFAPLSRTGNGFGAFLTVVLAMSVIANNIPNSYSFALSFQAFGRFAQSIPRFFLVIVATVIYAILAIAGSNDFETALNTLLVVLSYWLAVYCVILAEEHFIFRKAKWSNYDLENWNDPATLPIGFAAFGAVCFGAAGAVLGMAQLWYIGPLGVLIGDPEYGGDIGFELSGAFAALSYPVLRFLELKYVGR